MREILFRGKRIDNGEWVEGFYHSDPEDGEFISYFDSRMYPGTMDEPPSQDIFKVSHQVTHGTVGQYTGLRDKNGSKIFEGDVVIAWSQGSKGSFEIKWRQGGSPCWILFPAFQNGEMWHISSTEYGGDKKFIEIDGEISIPSKEGYFDDGLEITGNIHDKN